MNYLNELLIDELSDVYHAEKQLKALPKMAKAAQSEELRAAFKEHLEQTENQVRRVQQVFQALGEPAKAKPCKAMQGLIAEGEEIIAEHKGTPALDAALISAAQKIEHYEIATYGCLCTWAELLNQDKALQLLKQNIDEEETADKKLTEIAEGCINLEASEGDTESAQDSDRLRRPGIQKRSTAAGKGFRERRAGARATRA